MKLRAPIKNVSCRWQHLALCQSQRYEKHLAEHHEIASAPKILPVIARNSQVAGPCIFNRGAGSARNMCRAHLRPNLLSPRECAPIGGRLSSLCALGENHRHLIFAAPRRQSRRRSRRGRPHQRPRAASPRARLPVRHRYYNRHRHAARAGARARGRDGVIISERYGAGVLARRPSSNQGMPRPSLLAPAVVFASLSLVIAPSSPHAPKPRLHRLPYRRGGASDVGMLSA